MRQELPRELVLAIVPTTRGITYAYFEGPLSPVDWGHRGTYGADKNAQCFARVRELIEHLQPDVLVLHEYALPGIQRSARVRRLQHLIASYAATEAIEVVRYRREDIRATFIKLGAATKYEIAQVIASHIPAFSHRLPPPRKIWNKEDHSMALFDAASLAMVYFANRGLLPDLRG